MPRASWRSWTPSPRTSRCATEMAAAHARSRSRRRRWSVQRRRAHARRARGSAAGSSWPSWRRRALAPGEDEELRAERERLRGAEKFFGAASRGEEVLYARRRRRGRADRRGRRASWRRCRRSIRRSRRWSSGCAGAQAIVEDVARDLGRYASRCALGPGAPGRGRGAAVPARAPVPQARRHPGRASSNGARRSRASWPRWAPSRRGWRARRAAQARAEAAARAAADALSRARRKAASGLEKKIAETLRELGLAQARLPVLVEPRARLRRRRRRGRGAAEQPAAAPRRARRAPIGSASCSRPTRARSRGRWRGSPRAASCRG